MEDTPKTTRRTAWLERGAFAVVILGLAGWIAFQRMSARPCTICVDGKPIVSVESRASANDVLKQLRSAGATEIPSRLIRFSRPVSMRPADAGAAIVPAPEAAGALENLLSIEARVFAIVVDDKPAVALVKEADAEKTLDLLKQHYARKVDKLSGSPTFKEKVIVERRYEKTGLVRSSPEKAAEALLTIADEPIYHTVQRGDRVVNIARQYEVSLGDLKKLNPDMNMDAIIEGDRLLVKAPRPPVTVVTRGLVTKVVDVAAPPGLTQRTGARTGRRETKTVVTFENDEVVGYEVVSQLTVWNKPSQDGRTPRR